MPFPEKGTILRAPVSPWGNNITRSLLQPCTWAPARITHLVLSSSVGLGDSCGTWEQFGVADVAVESCPVHTTKRPDDRFLGAVRPAQITSENQLRWRRRHIGIRVEEGVGRIENCRHASLRLPSPVDDLGDGDPRE